MSQKGPHFERSFAKWLSLWWTYNEDDSLFWRTATSGARATARAKQGKTTKNAYGDIRAEDASAQALTSLILLELKRGYSHETIANLLDVMIGKPVPLFGKWIRKTMATAKQAGCPHWMIVSKRNQRDVMCWFDVGLWDALWDVGARIPARPNFYLSNLRPEFAVTCLRLDKFFASIDPAQVKFAWEKHLKAKSNAG